MSSGYQPAQFLFPTGTDIYFPPVDRGVIISGESHQVPFVPAYEFYLTHVPQTGSIIIPGYIEATGTPLGNQFQVVYTGLNAGLLTFNGLNAGDGPWGVTYTAYGDLVTSKFFTDLQTSVVNIESFIGTGLGISELYLRVTGGTITGDVVFNGANLFNASSGNSNIGGPANTFGNIYVNNVKALNTQDNAGNNVISYNPDLSLSSTIEVNVTAPSILLDGAITTNGNIVPQTNGVNNIGSTGSYFNNIYATTISSPSLNGQFVAKSGDSMTGNLTVNTQIVTNAVVGLNSSLSLTSTGSIIQVADGSVSIESSNSTVSITSPTSTVDINGALSVSPTFTTLNADVIPISPNFINLGSSGTPLGTVYANNIVASGMLGNFVAKSGDSMSGDLVMGNIGGTGSQPFIYGNNIASLSPSDDLGITGRQIDLEAQTSVRVLIGALGSNNFEVASAGIYVGQNVIPMTSGLINLGSTSSYYDHVYANNISALNLGSSSGITISSGNVVLGSGVNIETLLSGLNNIGSSGNPIGTIYVDTIISNGSTGTYVQKAGDTMAGNLTMASGANILATGIVNIGSTGNPISTLYVDSIITTTGSGTYVLKAGDNMTGALYVPMIGYSGNLVINGSGDVAITADNQVSITSATGLVFIDANTEAQLLANSIIQMTISQTGTQLANNIFPDISGNYSVGTALKPFGAIYADSFYTTATSGTGNFVLKIGDTMNGTLNFNSGIGITASNSGTSDIGTLASPFDSIYANNIYTTSPSSAFVHITGDTMTGPLGVGTITGLSTVSSPAGLAVLSLAGASIGLVTANGGSSSLTSAGAGVVANSVDNGVYLSSSTAFIQLDAVGSGVRVQGDISPITGTLQWNLGSSSARWSGVYAGTVDATALSVSGSMNPNASGVGTIGASGVPWSGLWIKNINGYPATTQVYSEIPTGLVDGINNIFTTAYIPRSGTERLYRAGLRQSPAGVDYTISTNTITFVVVPNSGDNILVDYERPIY